MAYPYPEPTPGEISEELAEQRYRRARKQRELVDKWNMAHDYGIEVDYLNDDGTKTRTRTRAHAELLGGHTAVVWIEGKAGCVALERITPV